MMGQLGIHPHLLARNDLRDLDVLGVEIDGQISHSALPNLQFVQCFSGQLLWLADGVNAGEFVISDHWAIDSKAQMNPDLMLESCDWLDLQQGSLVLGLDYLKSTTYCNNFGIY